MKNLLVVMLLLVCLPAAWGQKKKGKGKEAAVRAALTEFVTAAAAGDQAKLEGLLSDDLVYSHSNGRVENKAECIKAIVGTKPKMEFAPEQRVRIYGKSAVVRGDAKVNTTQNGQPAVLSLNVLQVWVNEGSSWKMVARQSTRLP